MTTAALEARSRERSSRPFTDLRTGVMPRTQRRRNNALAAQRKAHAIELAVQGRTYEQIANAVGYANRGTAYKVVRQALEERKVDAVDALRQVQADRLDALLRAVWDKALGGDLRAIQTALRVIETKSRLLGLVPADGARKKKPTPETVVLRANELMEALDVAFHELPSTPGGAR